MQTLRGRMGMKPALVFAALVAVGLGLVWMIREANAAATANVYSVDANPSTAGVQNTISKNVGQDFTVDHVIVSVADAWSAEQTNMKFDPAIVQFVSGPVDTNLGSAALCGGTTGADFVYEGCARISGTSTATGVTRSWTLHCAAAGTSALHLQTNAEVGVATGTNFAIVGGAADPVLHDASVTCTAVGGDGATPTATSSRTLTATATATGTATPTVNAATQTAQAATKTAQASTELKTHTPTKTAVSEATATSPATQTPVSVVSPAVRTPAIPTRTGTTSLPPSGRGTVASLDTLGGLWLILGVVALGALGGSIYLKSRRSS